MEGLRVEVKVDLGLRVSYRTYWPNRSYLG
jgi:hypothetical protein